jgi:class 3 adenylate cyclase
VRLECPACGAEQDVEAAFCSRCGTALRADTRSGGGVRDHEERRVVTVLFADLPGSSALAGNLDPEDAPYDAACLALEVARARKALGDGRSRRRQRPRSHAPRAVRLREPLVKR